jgi:hypothetical protein
MPSRKPHSGPPARQTKVSRRQADEARDELAAGGLSHQERRKLRSVIRTRDEAALRRGLEFKHIAIALAGTLAAMAVVALLVGLASAIEAARGDGTTGTFVVRSEVCIRRAGCTWRGIFRPRDGDSVPALANTDVVPLDARPGASIPVIEPPGSNYVYPRHGSFRWLSDLLIVVVVGGAVGFLLWISPLGLGGPKPSPTGVV